MVWGKGWGRGVGGGVGGMFREKQHALNKGHRATVARLTADQKVGSSSLSALIVYTSPRMGAAFVSGEKHAGEMGREFEICTKPGIDVHIITVSICCFRFHVGA